ncbi:hypothetical protein PCASD_10080 [Puccinia coronata f. sp. avenae]|uniref:Uncharacterized protein n=1 Tax=Puccinia coronata f. sp. avenae TaxID=200324 RepID=A0A2N5UW78_9BASI|nr:hypothetical protein PCASD_10080 [Puccinia coronata f. sp. avenae]
MLASAHFEISDQICTQKKPYSIRLDSHENQCSNLFHALKTDLGLIKRGGRTYSIQFQGMSDTILAGTFEVFIAGLQAPAEAECKRRSGRSAMRSF